MEWPKSWNNIWLLTVSWSLIKAFQSFGLTYFPTFLIGDTSGIPRVKICLNMNKRKHFYKRCREMTDSLNVNHKKEGHHCFASKENTSFFNFTLMWSHRKGASSPAAREELLECPWCIASCSGLTGDSICLNPFRRSSVWINPRTLSLIPVCHKCCHWSLQGQEWCHLKHTEGISLVRYE